MMYPTSFASAGQELDTGTKVVHAAPNTSSMVSSKSISKNGGKAIYRSAITVLPEAKNSKSSVSCESLMLDSDSRSDTIPVMDIRNDEVDIGHEAKIGRISEKTVFYLMTRGIGENEAKALIVRGFVEPIAKELPLEYAVEMNRLVTLEFEGSIG
jgi:Fe-S cluster assembly protein SufB